LKIILTTFLSVFSIATFATEIKIPNSHVAFDIPDEFEALSQEIIDLKWPSKRAPKWVVGNKSASTTIAYDLKPNDISTAPLSELLAYFTGLFDRMIPGIEWKEKKIIELAEKQWIYLEMTSNAVDTDIHNIMLLTSYGKEMLAFNFNSTKDEFVKYEDQLRTSIRSIEFVD